MLAALAALALAAPSPGVIAGAGIPSGPLSAPKLASFVAGSTRRRRSVSASDSRRGR